MNKIKYIILIFSLIISFTSCQKEAELTYANQEAKIDSYITSLMSSGEYELTRNGGSNRITTTKGSGEELREGGTISLYLAGYTFSNGFNKNGLFFTNSEEAATEAGWSITEPDYNILTVTLSKDNFIEGLYNGLIGVKGGECCQIVFSAKYGYGTKKNGMIPAKTALLYKVWVESISNE
jgi:hypothetical protein